MNVVMRAVSLVHTHTHTKTQQSRIVVVASEEYDSPAVRANDPNAPVMMVMRVNDVLTDLVCSSFSGI